VWLERALKPINDLGDEEILFFEPTSESSRRAAKLSRERIYARPDVVSKIPSTESEFQRYFKAAETFRTDAIGRREQLTKSRMPILILCGDNDPSVPATNWYPLVGKIPRAQLIVLAESGHGPQHQYPELSVKYIVAFLQSVAE
jgi:pimeloyl-ACP methyl ester carboxylesterase